MILEHALLEVRPDKQQQFEEDFATAQQYISAMPGYLGHQLQRCLEDGNKYLLLVSWADVEAHEKGFRQSAEYQKWRELLHHYYQPFPIVEHFELVDRCSASVMNFGVGSYTNE